LLDLKQGEDKGKWIIVTVDGSTPGKRYGHSLIYNKPHIILFGGQLSNQVVNDIWILSIEKMPFSWVKLDFKDDIPCARVYHSAALCYTGVASGMMVIFGGRNTQSEPINDIWGLRKHRDGTWEWVKAPCKASSKQPTARFQVIILTLAVALCNICWTFYDDFRWKIYQDRN
jgi:hypothetical protein